MDRPLISIIVPCYNQARYLSEALESVFRQTYSGWECIIINDGSTDNTEEVALNWVSKDIRFQYYRTENAGVSAARNYGIRKANGYYVLPLDGDDIIHQNYLEKAVDVFNQNSRLKIVYCKLQYFGRKNDWKLPSYDYKNLLVENMIFCSSVMKRHEILDMGGYDEKMVHGFEDWEFYINFLDEHSEVYQIDEVLFYYRLKEISRDADLSRSKVKMSDTLEYISAKHYDKYLKYYGSILQILRENKRLQQAQTFKDVIKSKLRLSKKS